MGLYIYINILIFQNITKQGKILSFLNLNIAFLSFEKNLIRGKNLTRLRGVEVHPTLTLFLKEFPLP